MLLDSLTDFYEFLFQANFVETVPEKRQEIKDKIWKKIPDRLKSIENFYLKTSKSGFAVGDSLTFADLALLNASLDWYGNRKEKLFNELPLMK